MPISNSAAGLPAAAAARNAGPPIPAGNAFAGCAAEGTVACVGAAMFSGPGIELVASAGGGAIRLDVGVGPTSDSVAIWRGGAAGGAGGAAAAAVGAAAAGGAAA